MNLPSLADPRELERIALLHIVAEMEDDRQFHREHVKTLSLVHDGHALAETMARLIADSYRTNRDEIRAALLRMIECRTDWITSNSALGSSMDALESLSDQF